MTFEKAFVSQGRIAVGKRGVTPAIKKELRRRSVVEPIIGHLKMDHPLGRNYLKGTQGDKLNALLSGAGYNFRLLLKWFRLVLACVLSGFRVFKENLWRSFGQTCRRIIHPSNQKWAF